MRTDDARDWDDLHARLTRLPRRRRYAPDAILYADLETRTPADRYAWDGLRRGADPAHSYVVFQVTLAGWGGYDDRRAGGTHPVGPGRAFAAVIPSAHRYYLPDDCPAWTFFFVLLRHEYVARRIGERQRQAGAAAAVLEVAPGDPLMGRALHLYAGDFPDRFAEEEAAFGFLAEYERHVHAALARRGDSTPGERDALLTDLRARVLDELARPLAVEEVARAHAMSRTRFSHRFKEATGEAPASYMARVRVEEAARRLVDTEVTLAVVAAETGFADANHLCKAFRRHFHLSPGAFRRQMR